jgi:hypothetical protein
MDTNRNGEIAEQIVATNLLELGFNVSKPVLEDRYDLIADIEGDLVKVQVKRGYKDGSRDDTFRANLQRQIRRATGDNRDEEYSDEDVDAFALYDQYSDSVYWLWKKDAPKTELRRKYSSIEKCELEKQLVS